VPKKVSHYSWEEVFKGFLPIFLRVEVGPLWGFRKRVKLIAPYGFPSWEKSFLTKRGILFGMVLDGG